MLWVCSAYIIRKSLLSTQKFLKSHNNSIYWTIAQKRAHFYTGASPVGCGPQDEQPGRLKVRAVSVPHKGRISPVIPVNASKRS